MVRFLALERQLPNWCSLSNVKRAKLWTLKVQDCPWGNWLFGDLKIPTLESEIMMQCDVWTILMALDYDSNNYDTNRKKNPTISLLKEISINWTNIHRNKMCLKCFYTNVFSKWGLSNVYFTRYHCSFLISQVESQQWVCHATYFSLFPYGSCAHISSRHLSPLLTFKLSFCHLA